MFLVIDKKLPGVFLFLLLSGASCANEVEEEVDVLYVKARDSYDIGSYTKAMEYLKQAKRKAPDARENPSVYVLSGMVNFKNNDCDSALEDVSKVRGMFDEMSAIMVQKKLNPIEYMGVTQYSTYNDNYFLATKISAFCNYSLNNMEAAERDFSYIEERWPREFDYQYKARLAHTFQMKGDDKAAVTYYLSALSELSSVNVQDEVKNKKKYIESSRYNLIISYKLMNNIKNAIMWGERLLEESESPMFWIKKMESDPDYKDLLVDKGFADMISHYKNHGQE